MADFNPAAHPYCLYYVPNIADEPSKYFIGNNSDGGNAVNAGDLVGTIEMGIGSAKFTAGSIAPSTERRPLLASDGLGHLGIAGASAALLRHGTQSWGNPLHVNRRMWGIIVYKMDTSIGATDRPWIDNTNNAGASTSGAQGARAGTRAFSNGSSAGGIFRKTNGSVASAMLRNSSTTPIIELITEEDLSEAAPSVHVFVFDIDPSRLSYARTDRGRKSYGMVGSTAGSGNGFQLMGLMNRASVGTQMPGILLALGVYSQYPGDEEVASWLERWPLGDIVGSPEIRVQDMHLNFSKDQAGMPYSIWWNKQRISAISTAGNEEGGNVVLNDGVGEDYLGGATGNSGGPHRNETLNWATVSVDGSAPVPLENGNIYEGASSVQVVRNTTIGISFEQVETHTITRNTERVNTVLTRLGDSRTINPLYFRESRANEYEDFLAFDADGEIVHDDSVTAADFEMDAGVVAVAQWAPSGVMALTIITKGRELNLTNTIFYSAGSSRRIYHRLNTIPTGTQSVEFETLSKYYEATEENWKALAQAELLKVLGGGGNAAIQRRRRA